jgi:hypothetical protein
MEPVTDAAETLSPAEVGAITGAPVRAVYRAAKQRLPPGMLVRRGRQRWLTRWGAVCFAIDRAMPRDVPLPIRRQLYTGILARRSAEPARYERGILAYVVDVQAVADRLDVDLARDCVAWIRGAGAITPALFGFR